MSRVLTGDVRTRAVFTFVCTRPFQIRQSKLGVPLLHRDARSYLSTGHVRPEVSRRLDTVSRWSCRSYSTRVAPDNAASKGDSNDGSGEDQAPTPPLAIVFTDIVKSTMLWEKDCDTMSKAMDIHDNLVRGLAARYAGYEVKQNGDGFMFAFPSAISALNFCLNIQVQLQVQEWPKALLELGPAVPVVSTKNNDSPSTEEKEEVLLWKGFRLRMSAHYGEPVPKWNEIIGRMDYLGPAVNRAARFVSVCEGGQIVVSHDFLQELKQARRDVVGKGGPLYDGTQECEISDQDVDLGELQHEDLSEEIGDTKFEVRMLGERHFKGVAEKQKLFFILPKSLRGRLEYLSQNQFVQASKGNLVDNG